MTEGGGEWAVEVEEAWGGGEVMQFAVDVSWLVGGLQLDGGMPGMPNHSTCLRINCMPATTCVLCVIRALGW